MENGNRDGTPESPHRGSRSRSHSPHRSRKPASRSRSRSKDRDHRRKKRGSESPKRYPSSYNQLSSRGGYPSELRGTRYGSSSYSAHNGNSSYSSRYPARSTSGRGYSGYESNGHRESPPEGRCLGVFGLHVETNEKKLKHVFEEFGGLEDIQLVYDAKTGRSRGFAFIYYESISGAKHAKEKLNGIEIDGRKIRVDFSLTQNAHAPTPGVYMGRNSGPRARSGYHGGGGYSSRYSEYPRESYHERDRYPPISKRRFSRSRSRSPRKSYHSYGEEKSFRSSRHYPSEYPSSRY